MPDFEPNELARWCGGQWTCPPIRPIRRVWQNSRETRPFDLYIALRGNRLDGHAFIGEAFQAGASAALVSREYAEGASGPHPLLVVDDPVRALQALARGHRDRLPGGRVGVTGSVGKTTIKDLAAAALSVAGPVAKTPGNWNNEIGLPLSLLAMEPEAVFGVFEVGMSRPGELAPLCDLLRPRWAVLARVGPVHIEFFESERKIAEEKAILLDRLPPDGFAVLASDEPWFSVFRERAPCRIVPVALSGPTGYLAVADPRGVQIREPDGTVGVYPLSLPGEAGRANTVRAVALARELGIPREAIAEALSGCTLSSMRWQRMEAGGVLWINDAYNASPVSMEAALRMFRESEAAPRKWLVLGGMRELGRYAGEAHLRIGRLVAEGDWAGLVTCGELARGYADGARAAGLPASRIVETASAAGAAAALMERLAPGDAVLLKGSRSERMEQILNEWENQTGAPVSKASGAKGMN
jgi:UDP-N-acetylmuramoyl-tripeptide--D-alanyl-D-alanine ligase